MNDYQVYYMNIWEAEPYSNIVDCDDTGIILVSSSYTTRGIIEVISVSGGYATCNLTTPWGTLYSSVSLALDTPIQYSNSVTRGEEYWKVTCTAQDAGLSASFTECYWLDFGIRYVKTSGDDSNDGKTWDTAWNDPNYGLANMPSFSSTDIGLMIEEGKYPDLTVGTVSPVQSTEVRFVDVDHQVVACDALLSPRSSLTVGSFGTVQTKYNTIVGCTFLETTMTIPAAGRLYTFEVEPPAGAASPKVKLKIFRDTGTNYDLVGESALYTVPEGQRTTNLECDILVQAGDLIGFYQEAALAVTVQTPRDATAYYQSGDITTSTAKTAWTKSKPSVFNMIVRGIQS